MGASKLCFVLLLTATLSAQDYPVTGTLTQASDGAPLGFATAVAYALPDSSMVANATTDVDGSFTLEVPAGEVYFELQFLGYDDLLLPARRIDGPVELGVLEMGQTGVALETVTVEAERSRMVMKLDKRVFTVGKDLTSAGSTAADILNNVPSVNVDAEGNVSLRGSNGVRILVDGKPSAMLNSGDLDALRRMQGDIIESVEVITNPSARYEAEGEAGIINIILKKNKKRGINGSFGLNAGYPTNYGASYNLNYRRNAFNLFSNFGISYRRSPGGGTNEQRFFNPDGSLDEYYEAITDQDRGGLGGNLQLGTDWFINDRTQLTGYLLYRRSIDDNLADVTYRDFGENRNLLRTTLRDTEEDSNNQNLESTLNFKRTYDRDDQEWTATLQYILDDDIELTDIVESYSDAERDLFQKSSNTEYETNLLAQTDYVHPFSDSLKIEGGLRGTFRTIRNAFQVREGPSFEELTVVGAFDDELEYTENILAGYFIGSGEFGRFGLQLGLRGEHSDVTASLLKSDTSNVQNYFNLFPSAALTYQFTDELQWQLSYSRRLSRPYFRLLLPFSNFNNPRNNSIGNPTLFPEYTDSYETGLLRYLDRGSVLGTAYYRRTTGVIQRLTLPADDGTTIEFPVNLGTRDAYGLEFNLSYDPTDWWSANANANFYQARVSGSFQEVDYDADITSWSSQLTNRYDASDRLQLQWTFDYEAPQNTPQGRDLGVWSIDIGASLEILASKGTLTLSGRDIFNTRIRRSIVTLPTYTSESDFQWRRVQSIVLSFVYRLDEGAAGRGGAAGEN